MITSQKDIYEYLLANPLNVDVAVGNVEDLNGKDYIFLDFLNDELIGYDDKGAYQSFIQITVCTRDFDNRRILTEYVKDKFNVSVTYEKSLEFEYYLARCNCGLILYEETET